jgi:hypothetical protein
MKWNKKWLIVVLIIFSISYFYSSYNDRKLSNQIKEKKLASCIEQHLYDCSLIELYHRECFDLSYRSEYKLKEFHPAEYDSCLNTKIKQHADLQ